MRGDWCVCAFLCDCCTGSGIGLLRVMRGSQVAKHCTVITVASYHMRAYFTVVFHIGTYEVAIA